MTAAVAPVEVGGLVARVAAELAALPETVGVIHHGSSLTGHAYPGSDVDLLCVTDADWFSIESRHLDGVEVEIDRTPLAKLERDLERYSTTNNNFALSVLTSGRVVADRDGRLRALVRRAAEVRRAGPPPPGPLEVQLGSAFLRHRLAELRARVHGGDPEGVLPLTSSAFLYNCIYLYCKMHGRWSTKLAQMLPMLRATDPEFHALCRAALDARGPAERLDALERVAGAVMEPVGWAGEEYAIPPIPLAAMDGLAGGLIV